MRVFIGTAMAVLVGGVSVLAVSTLAAESAQVENGHEQFNRWCAPCHGAGTSEGQHQLPGTASLQLKYKGSPPAVLEERTDLTPEALRLFVRRGVGGMPSFRKTEISDSQLADIAAYLTRSSSRVHEKHIALPSRPGQEERQNG